MPRTTIDTTEAKSFEAVEPGVYPMTIGQVDISKSKEKGEPMMVVHYKFDDPQLDQKAGSVMRNYMLAGKGAGFARELIKAVTGEDIPVGGHFDFDTDDLVGRPVLVTIKNKEYEGRLQNDAEKVVAI